MAAKQRERGAPGNGVDDLTSADGSANTAGNLLVYHQIYCLVRERISINLPPGKSKHPLYAAQTDANELVFAEPASSAHIPLRVQLQRPALVRRARRTGHGACEQLHRDAEEDLDVCRGHDAVPHHVDAGEAGGRKPGLQHPARVSQDGQSKEME